MRRRAAGGLRLAVFRTRQQRRRWRADLRDRDRLAGELREAEAKHRSIFENAIEEIFQTTPDGRFVTANGSLARMYADEQEEEHKAKDPGKNIASAAAGGGKG